MSEVPLYRPDRTPVFSADANQRDFVPRWEGREREFSIDNLMVQLHLIIEMISVDRLCAMGG